jgi:two-component sensor histidine kinase
MRKSDPSSQVHRQVLRSFNPSAPALPLRALSHQGIDNGWLMQPPLFTEISAATGQRILQVAKGAREFPILGYGTAFAAVGVATLIQWLAQAQYAGAPFLTIYPAVILAALFGGRGPGFLAAVLAGGCQWAFFIPTLHLLAVATYALDASVCVMLIDYINRTVDLLRANIDEEKQAKQHQYLLAKELHHRIQNLFTVIQGVIRFSLPGEGMTQESALRKRLLDRLQSMSAANRAITDSMGDGVRLLDLINGEIRGFESRVNVSGGSGLVLGPQMTQDFSMILHELVTNALKYGALSVAKGRVGMRLDWASPVLTFIWQESGGPAVSEPSSSGFGSRILGTFAKSFCRNVEPGYDPSGFRYTLQIESDQIKSLAPAAVPPAARDVAIAVAKTSEARPSRVRLEGKAELNG